MHRLKNFVFDIQRFVDSLLITGTAGNDVLSNAESDVTLNAYGGNDSIDNRGANVLINAGDDNDTIENRGDNSTINAGTGDDSVENSGFHASIEGGAGNDYIYNGNWYSSINGGSGNDNIRNYGYYSSIEGGTGDDYIDDGSWYSSIEGGTGDDYIYTYGSNNSIEGGQGDDTISFYSGAQNNLIVYNVGDGNDTIYGYNPTDTLQIGGSYSTQISGNDLILTVGNGKITVVGMAYNPVNIETVQGAYNNPLNIIGTEGDDDFTNIDDGATINALGGNDWISNYAKEAVIDGGDGDDYIYNTDSNEVYSGGSDVSIDGGAGNDKIENRASNVSILGGSGDDSIYNIGGSNVTIDAGTGNDTIENWDENSTINGGAGNDSIYNQRKYVSISGGADDDTISNNYDYVTVDAGQGNDSIYNSGRYSSIDAGAGKDSIYEFGSYNTINAGADDDTIQIEIGQFSMINAGDGNDSIYNKWGSCNSLSGGTGNDSIIVLQSGELTIDGGTGDDLISLSGSSALITYSEGDGNDYLQGFEETSTLQIGGGSGTYSSQVSGSDIIVTVGDGAITLQGAANLSNVNIQGNFINPLNVVGTEGADTIENMLDGATISALGGKDSISNSGSNVLIDAGTGDDNISNQTNNVSIDGGDGSDDISNWYANNVTINGGAGDDYINNYLRNGKNVLFTYNEGDGNDYIMGFDSTSTLQIGGGYGTYSAETVGTDIIVTVGNSKITLTGAANISPVNIDGVFSNPLNVVGTEYADYIYNTLDGATIQAFGGDDFIYNNSSYTLIDGGTGNDYISLAAFTNGNLIQYNSGDGYDTIVGFNATSNLQIGGGYGTYSTQQSGSDIIVNVDNGKITLVDAANLSKVNIQGTYVNPLLIVGTEGADNISNYSDGATINALGGNDSIYNRADNYGRGASQVSINGGAGNDYVYNDLAQDVNIIGETGNDLISNYLGSQVTISGGAGNDSIYNGGCFNNSVQVGGSQVSINGGAGNDFISNGAPLNVAGKVGGSQVTINGGDGSDTILNDGLNNIINGGAGDDSIYNWYANDLSSNGGSNVSINAGTGNDSIYNSAQNVTIDGGAGNDWIQNISVYDRGNNVTINGGAGNDTIENSGSNVLFTYTAGDGFDKITGFNNSSTLQIGGGTGTYSTQKSGSDIIVTVGNGKITLSGAANLSNVNIAGEYFNPLLIVGTEGADNINTYGYDFATVNALGGNDEIYNMGGKNVLINAGDGDDSIYCGVTLEEDGSSRIPDNATIEGGKGNDYISTEGANNLYKYSEGDGNDTIGNYFNGTLQIGDGTGTYSTQQSGSDIIVTVGNGKITLQGAASLSKVNIAGKNHIIINPEGTYDDWFQGTKGDDYIYNDNNNVGISAGAGDDYIYNSGDNVTVSAELGNDTIENDGSKTLFFYEADEDGNDLIQGFNETSTLIIDEGYGGGYGTYSAETVGSDIILTVGEGKITLQGAASLSTVNIFGYALNKIGKEDADNIYNTLDGATINGGAGNDSIYNSGSDVTIDGGDGDDTIENVGDDEFSYYYGSKKGSNVSINGGAGNDSISNGYEGGNNVTINGGAGDDTIQNDCWSGGGHNSYIDGGDGNDQITNADCASDVTIKGGAGNDGIWNTQAYGVDIDGGEGDDYISNDYGGGNFNGGEGDDHISNNNGGGNFNGGSGNDYISNNGGSGYFDGGDGNDTITNNGSYDEDGGGYHYGDDVTMVGGKGNDTIQNNGGSNVLFTYSEGDGNDSIVGFNATSTLQIGGGTGTYSTQKSGSDIIVTVGNGAITLQGAANLFTVNIVGNEIFTEPVWTLNGTTATYGTPKETLITVNGVKSLDGLTLNGSTVTVANSALNGSNVTISDGYTLKLANDVPAPSTTAADWKLNGTTATYNSASTSAGYTLSNNAIIYSKEKTSSALVTVSGVKSLDGLTLNGSTVTVANSALNGSNVTISDGYTLKLGNDVTSPSTTNASWTLNGTTAIYNSASTTAGYTLADNKISYVNASGGETLITVDGVKSLDGLSLSKKVVTVSKESLGTNKVTINDGYTLKLGFNVTTNETTEAWTISGTTAKYNQTKTAGYTLANNAITYSKKSTTPLATVEGVMSTNGLALDAENKIITVSSESLGTEKVTVDNDYTLALADDVSAPSTTKAGWKLSGTTATYNSASTSEGYTLSNNAINYSEGTAATTLVTVKGVKSLNGLSLKGKVVTVGAKSLGTKNITISDGYTLALAKGVSAPTTTEADWKLDGTTATYNSASTSAGYTLSNDGKSIKYSAPVEATALASIDGVKSVNGLTISGKTIKATATALSSNVSVSGDEYTFDFASNYKKAKISGGDDDDKIKVAGQRVTVDSGAGDDSLVFSDKYASINAGSGANYVELGTKASNSTIRSANGNDTVSNKAINALIDVKGGNDLIVNEGAGTTIDSGAGNDSIENSGANVSISAGDGADTVLSSGANVTLSGGKGNDFISSGGIDMAYISGTNGNDDLYSGRNADHLDGGAGDDTLVANAGNDTLEGGTGNDELTGGDGADTFVYNNGDGNDIITDYEEEDTIKIASGTISKITTNSAGNVIFKIGKGQITVQDAAKKVISYEDAEGNKYLYPINFNAAGTAATLTANYGKDDFDVADFDDYAGTLKNIDASKVEHDMTIVGNKLANKITGTGEDDKISGGAGKDTLIGGDGNDSLNGGDGNDSLSGGAGKDTLVGGKGSDIFVYSDGDGNDIITDYSKADGDKIRILSGEVSETVAASNGNVIVKVGNGQITVKNAASTGVTLIDAKGNEIETGDSKDVKYNTAGTAATLTANYTADEFTPTEYADVKSTLKTIDASAVNSDLKITANKQANNITGSTQDDFIDGAGGADTIYGGAGADTLYGNAGNDKLYGDAGNDSLSGGAGADTLEGGAGSDKLTGGAGADLFVYNNGDGADVITDYEEGVDKIQIASGSITSITPSKKNLILKVGKGQITINNAAEKAITVIDAKGNESVINDSKSVVYNEAGTSATLSSSYEDDNFTPTEYADVKTTLKTINAAAVEHDLTITGNKQANNITGSGQDDFIDGAAGADVITGGAGNDTLYGNAGNDKLAGDAGNDSLSGGAGADTLEGGKGTDTLVGGAGADLFVYNNGDGNDIISDYEEGVDKIQIASGSITSITPSKKNLILKVGRGQITINNAAEKAITVIDADGNESVINDSKSVVYNEAGTTATLSSSYEDDNFTPTEYADVKTTLKTINAAAVEHDLTITGNKQANHITGSGQDDFIDGAAGADVIYGGVGGDTLYGNAGNDKLYGETGNDSLSGGAGADTLEGGKGTDTLVGGAGADLFVYNNGDGNDIISDYEDGDKIQIASGTISTITTSKKNVIFTVGKGKITVQNASEQAITYIDADGVEHKYNDNSAVVYNEGYTSATLTAQYTDDAFIPSNYSDYTDTLKTINAAAVEHEMTITGNKLANHITGTGENDTINGADGADKLYGGDGDDSLIGGKGNDALYGGDGNDTLWGGAGTDTLTGGDGRDTFIYNAGEGNVVIADYSPKLDTVIVNGGVTGYSAPSTSNDVIFTMSDGAKLTFTDCKNKNIVLKDSYGNSLNNGTYYAD